MCDNIQAVSYKRCLPTFEGSPDDTLGYIDLQYNPQAFKLPHSSSQSKFNSLPNIKSRRRSHYISTLENSFYPKSEKLNNLTMEVTPKDTENKTVEPTKDEDTESKTSESTTVVISTSDSVCSDSPRGVTNEAFEDDEEVDSSCKKGHRRSPSTSNIKDEKTCDVSYSSAGSSAIEIPIPMTKEDLKAKELAPEYQLVMPDTQLRKGWRGEKLYFAKGNSDPRADGHVRRFCWWMVCLVLLAGAITVAGLIGVGVIKLPLHLENERIHSYHSGEEPGPGPRLGQVRDQDAPPGISSIDTIVLYDYHEEELPEPEPQPVMTTDRTEYPTQTTEAEIETQTTSETTTHKVSQRTHAAEHSNTRQQEFSTASTETEQEKITIQTDQTITQTDQAITQTEQAVTQTEQAITQTEPAITQTEQAIIEKEQAFTRTEQAITQTEEVSNLSEQVSTQTEETVETTTITKEESSQTKPAMPEWEITPVETTQILDDQSTETSIENKQTTTVSDIEITTQEKQVATEQEVTFITTQTKTLDFVTPGYEEEQEEDLVEGSGETTDAVDELGSGNIKTNEKLKTISVEGLLKEDLEASGDVPETEDEEQMELNTDYILTRDLNEDNADKEMELVITLPQLLTGSFRDIIEGDGQDGSGDNSFELNQPPESDGESFENGEDVFRALLDLILPKKSEKAEDNIETEEDVSLGELIKHIGSQ